MLAILRAAVVAALPYFRWLLTAGLASGCCRGVLLHQQPHCFRNHGPFQPCFPSCLCSLPAFGGSHRAYYAWRWPLLRHPLQRILVESDVPDLEIATYPAPATLRSGNSSSSGSEGGGGGGTKKGGAAEASGAGGNDSDGGPESMEGVEEAVDQQRQQQQRQQQQQRGAVGVAWEHNVVQQATLSPAGALLAFTELAATRMGALESWVVIADARTGRRVCSVPLADPHPPFYFFWLSCGTRLLFLR